MRPPMLRELIRVEVVTTCWNQSHDSRMYCSSDRDCPVCGEDSNASSRKPITIAGTLTGRDALVYALGTAVAEAAEADVAGQMTPSDDAVVRWEKAEARFNDAMAALRQWDTDHPKGGTTDGT